MSGADAGPNDVAREQVVTSTGRLHPGEDETSGEFADRVARIKADVLRRALAALETASEEPVSDEVPRAEADVAASPNSS